MTMDIGLDDNDGTFSFKQKDVQIEQWIENENQSANLELDGTGLVRWGLELDVRSWGIKSIIPSIPDQTVTVVDHRADDGVEDTDIELTDVQCELESDTFNDVSQLYLVSLEFIRNEWIAKFST